MSCLCECFELGLFPSFIPFFRADAATAQAERLRMKIISQKESVFGDEIAR